MERPPKRIFKKYTYAQRKALGLDVVPDNMYDPSRCAELEVGTVDGRKDVVGAKDNVPMIEMKFEDIEDEGVLWDD